jgi:DNA polymerase
MTPADTSNDSPARLARDLKQHLVDHDGELVYWGEEIVIARSGDAATKPSQTMTSKAETLEQLRRDEIGDCHRCPLGDTRIQLVFGVGNPEARVMFVGEGPGFEEDRKGEPFVGKAGQLLDRIMAAIGLDRTSVYIANVVKCHPMTDPTRPEARGNDRPPTPEEMDQCRPFLKKQIAIIRPEIIVTLGATSTRALLGAIGGITSVRGRIFNLSLDDGTTVPVLPTFHPAALLRDPELKKPVWEDMKQLRDRLGLPAAGRQAAP